MYFFFYINFRFKDFTCLHWHVRPGLCYNLLSEVQKISEQREKEGDGVEGDYCMGAGVGTAMSGESISVIGVGWF